MIALKIIGSGSLYFAVHSKIEQSNASTLTPVCCAVSPVLSGSVSHDPVVTVVPPSPFVVVVPPLFGLPLLLLHAMTQKIAEHANAHLTGTPELMPPE
jgi:hypothetical protein